MAHPAIAPVRPDVDEALTPDVVPQTVPAGACHTDPCGRSTAARLRALRLEVAELEQRTREDLRRTIVTIVGPGVAFSARALFDHRVVSPELAEAFADAGLHNARQLGKKLRQLGLLRVGVDEHGAIWVCPS
jgi:hypothetical protein